MTRKIIRNALLILLGLFVLIPVVIYVSALDLSNNYSASFEKLPLFDANAEEGTFRLKANALEFKIRVTGLQNTGGNVIFLHGFPQTSSIWEPSMKIAAAQGYRVLAFDQRGYSPGARPKEKAQYDIDYLVDDLLSIASQVGFDTFHLVGHDWGASVGWKTTMDHSDRVQSWTALSIPHIGVFQDALQNNVEQQKRSSYISRLETPEKMMQNVRGVWRDEEIEEISALFAEHGAITAALNWYRAADLMDSISNEVNKRISVPTLFIWGNQDPVIAPQIIPNQKVLMDTSYHEVELNAGHSLIQEKKDTIIKLMLKHWGEH